MSLSVADLAGRVQVQWRQGAWRLRSTRHELAPRFMRGTAAARAPARLAMVFALCGHAHHLAASLALRAAQSGQPAEPTDAQRVQLAVGTAQEHLLRLALQSAGPDDATGRAPPALAALAGCPLWGGGPAAQDGQGGFADLAGWLARAPAFAAPAQWPTPAAAAETGPVALPQALGLDAPEAPSGRACRAALALAMRDQPDFCLVPDLNAVTTRAAGAMASRGAAMTLHDPAMAPRTDPSPNGGPPVPATGAWSRAAAATALAPADAQGRWDSRRRELHRLAAPDGSAWLAAGAQPLGRGESLAWVEMARGLLLHCVGLQGEGESARIDDWRVLAPTEWNLHPQGELAQALFNLPRHTSQAALRALVESFDPCVPVQIDMSESGMPEPGHA